MTKGIKEIKQTPPTILERIIKFEENISLRMTELERLVQMNKRDIDALGSRQGISEMFQHQHNEG